MEGQREKGRGWRLEDLLSEDDHLRELASKFSELLASSDLYSGVLLDVAPLWKDAREGERVKKNYLDKYL